jgi:hypothetical protein
MDAATFCGAGALSIRVADFLVEHLDGAGIALLDDADLQNVNGAPLDAQQLVRRAGGARAAAARGREGAGAARARAALDNSGARGVPRGGCGTHGDARARHRARARRARPHSARATYRSRDVRGARRHGGAQRRGATRRAGWHARPNLFERAPSVLRAHASRACSHVASFAPPQDAHRLRKMLYQVRPELVATKGDQFEAAFQSLAELRAADWCAGQNTRARVLFERPSVPAHTATPPSRTALPRARTHAHSLTRRGPHSPLHSLLPVFARREGVKARMRNEVNLALGDINELRAKVHPAPLALEAPIAAFPPVDVKARARVGVQCVLACVRYFVFFAETLRCGAAPRSRRRAAMAARAAAR